MGKKLELPQYSLAQELWNSISHGLGALLVLIAAPFVLIKAIDSGDVLEIVSVSIYLPFIFLTFLMSCLYHSLAKNGGKRVLRVLDHDFVFLSIMGTYVPYCLVGLKGDPAWGYSILSIVWAGSITGIALNSVNLKKFNVVNIILYIALGSTAVLAFYPLYVHLRLEAFLLLLFGGVAYWIGAMLYGLGGKKNLWFHAVFHFFVLFGAILMFLSLYLYVL